MTPPNPTPSEEGRTLADLKLTKAQRRLLTEAASTGSLWLRNHMGNTAVSLCRLGLLTRLGFGAYLITPEGRKALGSEGSGLSGGREK